MKQEATKATSDILAFNKVAEEYIRQCKPPRLRQLHVLADLKDMWKKAYHANKTDEILDGLINVMKKIAVKTEGSDGYPQIDTFNDLSGYLAERHRRSKRINDLKESIEYAIRTYKAASAYENGKAFENMIMKGGARGSFLWNIAEKYFQLFQSTKGKDDLEKAIGYLEDSVKYTKPDKELVLSQRYHALGSWYKALYGIAKNRKTLEKSVKAFEEAVVAIPEKQRAFVGDFDDLVDEIVKGYTLLHEVTGDAEFLSKANQAKGKREVSKKIDSEVKTRHVDMEKSVFGALSAFQASMKEEDLDKAISEVRKQLEREENPGGMMDTLKTRLVNLLMERYQGLGGVEDLREVIRLVSYPIGNINWTVGVENKDVVSLNLSIRSLAHGYLFEREFEEKDWDNAVRFGKAAVSLSESEEVHPRNVIYAHMGVIHMSKFKQDREIAWLDEATTWFRKAVDANEGSETGKADTYDLCRDMANLASSGYMKFEMTGKLDDLQTAIGWAEEAMEVDDSGRPWKSSLASNLGSMLHSRFTRLRDDSDLEEAIRLHRKATKTSKGALGDFSKMNNLASALFTRFQISGSEEDLDEAIQLLQDANEKVPIGHPSAHPLLQNLREVEAARQAAKSKVPPLFGMMVEALTGMPFDESSVSPYVQALLDQGKRNGEFGPDGLGFNPFAGLPRALGMGGLALPDPEDLDLPDLGRLRMEAPRRSDEFGTAEQTSGRGPPRGLPGFEQPRLSAPKQETRAESSTNRLSRGFPDFDRVSDRVRPSISRQGSEGQSIGASRYPTQGLPIIAESSSSAPRVNRVKRSGRRVWDFFSLSSKRKSQDEDGKF